jgi:hypothetical protein
MTIKLFTLVMTLITSSFAFSSEIASHRFTTFGDIRGTYQTFQVTIDETQTMNIKMTTSKSTRPHVIGALYDNHTQKFRKDLNNKVFAKLKKSIVRLSKSKISIIHNVIVCRMMPGPTMTNDHLNIRRDYDYSTSTFLGEMKLVSNPSGCWQTRSIFPKNDNDKAIANELKAIIKIIVLDITATDL